MSDFLDDGPSPKTLPGGDRVPPKFRPRPKRRLKDVPNLTPLHESTKRRVISQTCSTEGFKGK